MNHTIYPCLWFDGNAKEAAAFYCTVFDNAKITSENEMVVMLEIAGKKIMGLNGGPMYKINPSISFFVTCDSVEEIDCIWDKLMVGGTAMMPLDKYAWAERYGFVKDKFGVTWQLIFTRTPTAHPKIMMSMLFVGGQFGRAEEAIKYYNNIFADSGIDNLKLYEAGEAAPEGKLAFGQFTLGGEKFVAMDGAGEHPFQFNEAVSFVVPCDTQAEIDDYWSKLTEGGEESQCGWLKDKFGVSWQIVPSILGSLLNDADKAPKVMQAFMKMKKFDLETLLNAYNHG